MLHGVTRMIRGSAAACRHHNAAIAGGQNARRFSVAPRSLSSSPRDYALPNAAWTAVTRETYAKYLALTEDGSWRRLPSYNTTVHHRDGMCPEMDRKTRLFTRNVDEDGVGFEYCMFYNKGEKRTVCIFQPGPYLEGPEGYTHGGCIATIIDTTLGTGIVYGCGMVMTANLSIDYRSPIPLGCTVLIDCRVDKVEGRKVYTSCQVRSHDGAVLHNQATALFIKTTPGESEAKL